MVKGWLGRILPPLPILIYWHLLFDVQTSILQMKRYLRGIHLLNFHLFEIWRKLSFSEEWFESNRRDKQWISTIVKGQLMLDNYKQWRLSFSVGDFSCFCLILRKIVFFCGSFCWMRHCKCCSLQFLTKTAAWRSHSALYSFNAFAKKIFVPFFSLKCSLLLINF